MVEPEIKEAGGLPSQKSEPEAIGTPPEPNIIFCRKVESKGETILAEPPPFINDGMESIKLPPAAEQLKGFFHPQAGQIIAAMPKAYKRVEKKGAK